SAGADLAWMKSMAGNNYDENVADSMELAKLMKVLANSPHPTVCLVQGAAFGGALGLIACCDIAVATPDAKFCLSEVKLGLIPAVISPYVIRAIGERQARRYFLSAEIFTADKALGMGLIHEIA
ncbi:enoyl-CoA hydratase-related protein, partial [Pseudoalteromonas piscicida]|uniref:enoyl-CoA hydratase-related protein n=1 Tax=Pseudoalteromonas piscicida TaxID=43662 RepID=UPI001273C381